MHSHSYQYAWVVDELILKNGTVYYRSGGSAGFFNFAVGTDVTGPIVRPYRFNPNYWYRQNRKACVIHTIHDDGAHYDGKAGYPSPIGGPHNHPDWDRVYNSALDDLNEKVRGSLDLSIDTFQARQTASLSRYLRKALTETAKFAKGLVLSPTKELSKRYLEYLYGVKPTLQSIYDLYDHYYDNSGLPVRLVSRKQLVSETTSSRTWNFPSGGPTIGDCVYQRKTSTRCHLEIMLKLRDLSQMQEFAGFTSLNPLSVAYELVPYSFVVDWFYDLGGYIRNFETALVYGDLFDKGFCTRTQKDTATDRSISSRYADVKPVMVTPGTDDWTTKSREVLGSYPFPRRPVLNLDLSSQKLFNTAALLGNLLPDLGERISR